MRTFKDRENYLLLEAYYLKDLKAKIAIFRRAILFNIWNKCFLVLLIHVNNLKATT
jgi:hypothetical protein